MMNRIAYGDRIKSPKLPCAELTSLILKCCFEVMNELGIGFLESVYKNALFLTLHHPFIYPTDEGDPIDLVFNSSSELGTQETNPKSKKPIVES